jgi:F0F1-type ATP synthase gamma subunit
MTEHNKDTKRDVKRDTKRDTPSYVVIESDSGLTSEMEQNISRATEKARSIPVD